MTCEVCMARLFKSTIEQEIMAKLKDAEKRVHSFNELRNAKPGHQSIVEDGIRIHTDIFIIKCQLYLPSNNKTMDKQTQSYFHDLIKSLDEMLTGPSNKSSLSEFTTLKKSLKP